MAKREKHRLALRAAATSGEPRFFLGTDSAPHTDALKEHACGCAGCFTATNTMPLLAHVFEEEARWTGWKASPRSTAPPSTACPRTRHPHPDPHSHPPDLPRKDLTEAGPVTVFNPGFPVHWHVTA